MKQHLEIEYKTIVSKENFDTMLNHFAFNQPVEQVNTYFDDQHFSLFHQQMMCRIRKINGINEFTLKKPTPDGVQEFELILKEHDLNDERVIELLDSYGVDTNQIHEIAKSTTYRSTYHDQYGVWCLDESHFNHHIDFEIEYELDEFHPLAFDHYQSVLSQLKIPYQKAKPKYLRALHSVDASTFES